MQKPIVVAIALVYTQCVWSLSEVYCGRGLLLLSHFFVSQLMTVGHSMYAITPM